MCRDISLELGNRVAVSLESTIENIGTVIVHEWDSWLVHGTVPLHVARASVTVSVNVLVRKMEHRVLASPPLTVCIRNWGVLGQDTSNVPVEQVRVVSKRLGIESIVVHHDGTVVTKTLTESSNYEVGDPEVSKTNTHVEALDWELTNNSETKEATNLGAGGVISPVEIRFVDGSGDFFHLAAGEPASEDGELTLGLRSPGGHDFLEVVFGHTETDQVVVLDVLGLLRVDLSTLHIVVGVLLFLSSVPSGTILSFKRNFGMYFTHLI